MSSTAPTPYAGSIAFLLSAVGARTAQLFAQVLEPLGLTTRAFGVLTNVAAHGPQTQQELADGLGIHRNNMVGLVDELEGAGWVRRRRNQSDRRAFDIILTARGAAMARRANAVIPPLDQRLAAALTPAQHRSLSAALSVVAADLDVQPGVHPWLARARPNHAGAQRS